MRAPLVFLRMKGFNQQLSDTMFSFLSTSFPLSFPHLVFLNYEPFLLKQWYYLLLQALCFILPCITAQKVDWYLGSWKLWTALSNILLVLALIFSKPSPAHLNTLWLLSLMALVSLRLDVSHTSDPLCFSLISSFPASFFGKDRSHSYRIAFKHVANLLLSKGCRLHSCNSSVEADEPWPTADSHFGLHHPTKSPPIAVDSQPERHREQAAFHWHFMN